MRKEKKGEVVTKVEEWLSKCDVAIVTDYRGLTVRQISQLRRQLRESGTDYHVVKNNLARIAAERVGKEELKNLLTGPSAIAFGHGEVSELARVLNEQIRALKLPISITGGLLGNTLLSATEITVLSNLPSREALVSRLIGQMQAPISSLLAVLSANLTGIVRVLQARKQQLEGG